MIIKLTRAVLAVIAVAVTIIGLSVAPVAAALGGDTLRVSQNSSGAVVIQQGTLLHAGKIKVGVTSTSATADVEIFQLLNNATLAEMDVKIGEAGQGGAVAAAAMRWFEDNTRFYGGLSAVGTVSFQTVLRAGNYYVAQVNAPSSTAQSFRVIGNTNAYLPSTNQSVRMIEPDQFEVNAPSGHLKPGPITIKNDSDELHFVWFVQVNPGTTDADVTAWLSGGADPTLPGGQRLNFGTQSPNRASVVNLNLPSGTYMLLDFIPDDETGTPHAFTGMHTVVTVN